jgi:hypothetical protein
MQAFFAFLAADIITENQWFVQLSVVVTEVFTGEISALTVIAERNRSGAKDVTHPSHAGGLQ